MGRIGADAGNAQQVEKPLEALRQAPVNLGKNGSCVCHPVTGSPGRIHDWHNVTAAGRAARATA
jgi:hypothetical protein